VVSLGVCPSRGLSLWNGDDVMKTYEVKVKHTKVWFEYIEVEAFDVEAAESVVETRSEYEEEETESVGPIQYSSEAVDIEEAK